MAEKIVAVTTSGTTKRDSICDVAEGLDRGANSSAKDIPGRPPNEAEIKSHSKILALRVGDNIMALLLLMLLGLNFNEVNRVYRLYQDGQLDSEGFGKFYKPLDERTKQLQADIPRLLAEIDLGRIQTMSAQEVGGPVWNPRRGENSLRESPRRLSVGKDEIDITFL